MKRPGAVVGIVVGLLLGVAGFALAAVGLMAMGAETPKLVVFLAGFLLLIGAISLIAWSVLHLRRTRPRSA